ncbi:AAA family ATPase [Campylobacter sp. 2018MI13]|uniref:McrB family protein n=1 Tax=Campylobacter sp. 2018MI13 TaxID=2836737 RepID=UPI002024729E|nr:AAA family ATPase [Campylobacter sp. 2018MI13]
MPISFTDNERKEFQSGISAFISEINKCLKNKNKSTKGFSVNNIKPFFNFFKNSYEYSIGSGSGTLADTCWIIFVRKELLSDGLINTSKVSPRYGVYVYFGYSHSLKEGFKYRLAFGFPKHDIENARCKAVDEMERSGKLTELDFTYYTLDLEQITDDFIKLLECYESFSKDDFIPINQANITNNLNNTNDIKNIPLNQILYGAPGVGKTYDTINIALEILGEDFSTQTNEINTRQAMQKKFKEYVENGQIVFITFHQSYGYEEFVEGIRPDFDNEELKYMIDDGVFKALCNKAKQNYINYSTPNELDFDKLINYFAEYVKSEFLDQNKEFELEKGANIHSVYYDKNGCCYSFRLGGATQSGQRLTLDIIKRDYKEFKIGNIKSYKDIKPKFESKKIHHGNARYYFMLYKKLFEFEKKDDYKNQKEDLKPYIIIIDEINRGNISKIFGELITLIEPSKRLGNTEELEVVLPYSKESFGVPNNVYIIGTMNTADKSITTLDTALRRRFEFKKMMPNSFLLNSNCDGINLQELLNKMNERIECLIGDEKLIGHSYFMGINKIDELKVVFRNKILPLLEEYFYNDYSQIKSVLNDNGMIKTKNILNTNKFYLSDDFNETDFKKIYED